MRLNRSITTITLPHHHPHPHPSLPSRPFIWQRNSSDDLHMWRVTDTASRSIVVLLNQQGMTRSDIPWDNSRNSSTTMNMWNIREDVEYCRIFSP